MAPYSRIRGRQWARQIKGPLVYRRRVGVVCSLASRDTQARRLEPGSPNNDARDARHRSAALLCWESMWPTAEEGAPAADERQEATGFDIRRWMGGKERSPLRLHRAPRESDAVAPHNVARVRITQTCAPFRRSPSPRSPRPTSTNHVHHTARTANARNVGTCFVPTRGSMRTA